MPSIPAPRPEGEGGCPMDTPEADQESIDEDEFIRRVMADIGCDWDTAVAWMEMIMDDDFVMRTVH